MQEKTPHRNMRAAGLAVAVFLMTLLTNACDGDSGGRSYLPASSLSLETTTEMPRGFPSTGYTVRITLLSRVSRCR
jgi:hypothetical protein